MPRCLNSHMTDDEILRCIAAAYSDPENWKSFEKDVGGRYPMKMPSWASRDQGDYARRAYKIMHDRSAFHCPVCEQVSYGPYKIGPVEVKPACRNDHCDSQWWNKGRQKPIDLDAAPERLRAALGEMR